MAIINPLVRAVFFSIRPQTGLSVYCVLRAKDITYRPKNVLSILIAINQQMKGSL